MRHALRVGLLALALIDGVLLSKFAAGEEINMFDGQWHANATLYAWFANMNTTFRVPAVLGGGSTTVEVKPSSYLKDLQFGAMLAGELRKGDWSFATDLIYADLANLSSKVKEIDGPVRPIPLPAATNVNSGVRSTVWTLVAG